MICLMVGLVLSSSFDTVFLVRTSHNMQHYSWVLSQVIYPASIAFLMLPVVWLRQAYGTLERKHYNIAKWRIALIAVVTDAANLMVVLTGPRIGGPMYIIVSKMIIPILMFLAFLFLHTRYKWNHILGCVVLLMGLAVSVFPRLNNVSTEIGYLTWVAVAFCSNIPLGVSVLLKEKYLKTRNVDVWYFRAWLAVFELLCGLLYFPTIFLPGFSGPSSVSSVPDYFANASACFCGLGSDTCKDTWLPYIFFVTNNILFNVLSLAVIKYASGAVSFLVAAAQVPLSAFLFLVPMFAGPVARHSINIRKVVSLGIVALGILFYRLHSEVQTSPSPKLLGIQSSHTSPVYSINIQEDDIFDAAQFNEGKQ